MSRLSNEADSIRKEAIKELENLTNDKGVVMLVNQGNGRYHAIKINTTEEDSFNMMMSECISIMGTDKSSMIEAFMRANGYE